MGYFQSIYADDLLPHRAKTVYMYLQDRSNKDGTCWPGITRMAKELNLSRTTVKRALRDLVEAGYVEKVRRYRENGSDTSNLYVLLKARR